MSLAELRDLCEQVYSRERYHGLPDDKRLDAMLSDMLRIIRFMPVVIDELVALYRRLESVLDAPCGTTEGEDRDAVSVP